jgi:plasmid stability protein
MTEPMSREQVLAGIRQEIAEQRDAAQREPDPVKRDRMLRHARSRDDLADEEADEIIADIAENEQAALSLRVPASLSAALKARAAAEHIPTSALVRRILTQAVEQPATPVLTVEQVEQIARRVYRESA